jgi:hypothetical protein
LAVQWLEVSLVGDLDDPVEAVMGRDWSVVAGLTRA